MKNTQINAANTDDRVTAGEVLDFQGGITAIADKGFLDKELAAQLIK